MTLYAHRFPTPLGPMLAAVDDDGALVALHFSSDDGDAAAGLSAHGADVVWDEARCDAPRRQVEEYFRGERTAFELPVAPRGSDFQRRVWAELARIPYGRTVSYGELARRVGRPGAARAVGRANATNPIPVVLPCHRVVGADGTLTGYAGGMERKERLLALEGARLL